MDMADIKMTKSAIRDVERSAASCWDAMTENNIELRLRFSLIDMIMAAAGAVILTVSIGAIKKMCHQRKIKREAEKLAKQKAEKPQKNRFFVDNREKTALFCFYTFVYATFTHCFSTLSTSHFSRFSSSERSF